MMYQSLKYMMLTVQLADKRVLLHRTNHGGWPMWSVTHELYLNSYEVPLVEANRVLLHHFQINTATYKDDFADIKQYPPQTVATNRLIYPFILRMKQTLNFRCKSTDEYRALDWYEIIDDVIKDSTHRSHAANKYTPTAAFFVKTLNQMKVFD